MKENNINFINKFKISLYNIKKYNDLIILRFSHAIIYSIILSLIAGSILGCINFSNISKFQKLVKTTMENEKYEFELHDGILDFKNSPIKSESGKFMILVDTNIGLEDVDTIRNIIVHKDMAMVILKDGIYTNTGGQKAEYKYSDMSLLVDNINNESLIKSLDYMWIFKYIIFIASIIWTYVSYIFNSLILSLVGLLLSKINNINLKYIDVLKLCIYSMTLPIIIRIFYPLGSLSILIAGVYLILWMNRIRREGTI